jgi:hypothetical protein
MNAGRTPDLNATGLPREYDEGALTITSRAGKHTLRHSPVHDPGEG